MAIDRTLLSPRHPNSENIDPYGAQSTVSRQPVHAKADGYLPGWRWKAPPGIGDAPQHVYTTFTLIPFDVRGPGDNPVTYLRSLQAPVMQNFAMRWQGMPVDGGSILMTGLYTPTPMGSPGSEIYPGV